MASLCKAQFITFQAHNLELTNYRRVHAHVAVSWFKCSKGHGVSFAHEPHLLCQGSCSFFLFIDCEEHPNWTVLCCCIFMLDVLYPGHAAAYRGNLEVLHLLLRNKNVDINDRDDRGATLAHQGMAMIKLFSGFLVLTSKYSLQC